jgi:Flp pilus assembly CpaF family ATPase
MLSASVPRGISVAVLLDTVANQDHPIVEGGLPCFGFRFEGLVPPVTPRATAAIRKHSSRVRTSDDYLTEERIHRRMPRLPANRVLTK